jgi:transcriptional regulator of acetoin/glycerol metabolism
MIHEHDLQEKYETIFPVLNERQRRVIAAADAFFLSRGAVSQVTRASGLSRTTIHRGAFPYFRSTYERRDMLALNTRAG